MRKIIWLVCVLFVSFYASAQNDLHCATDVVMKKIYQQHPELVLEKRNKDLAQLHSVHKTTAATSYTIPIVFHILHTGGPENISDDQVRDGVRILNRDYAKQNSDTAFIMPEFISAMSSTGIQFVLATKDPAGNCTNGIVHYYDIDTDWDESSPTLYSHTWNPTKYLNVYIVKTITMGNGFGAAGYTYFPGTFAPGSSMDAIVVLNNYFGSIGTGNNFLSRVLTHEVGHWLNLYHVFGLNAAATACDGDDFVDDTPSTMGFVSCPDMNDPSSYQICNPGVSENFQNYMDYSYCCKMFTNDQAQRMRNALESTDGARNNLSSPSNLLATGVVNPIANCIPNADFNYNRSVTCVGAPVIFSDASTNAQTTNYYWQFPGGIPGTSTLSAPAVIYNTPGVYSVTYTAGNVAGTSSPITKSSIITVVSSAPNYTANYTESFETNSIPGSDWTNGNTSGGTNWEQSFDVAYTGSGCAKLPTLNHTRMAKTWMVSPAIDISAISLPQLSFKLSTAEVNPNHINTLKVFISNDCETTWTEIYSKTGTNLVTSNSTFSPFYPTNTGDWRNEIIDLNSMSSYSHAKFKFIYIRDTISGASNVFIDDINISSTSSVKEITNSIKCQVFPNPLNDVSQLEIDNTKTQLLKINITDVLGQEIFEIENKIVEQGNYKFPLFKNDKLKAGIYFIKIENPETSVIKKLIVN